MKQSIFTFITKVNPARETELTHYLAQVRKNIPRDPDLPFASLPMLHFTSLTLFPDDTYGTYLVFESNVDGTPQAYLDALLDVAAPALHRIYGMCLEYDGAARTTARGCAASCSHGSSCRTRATSATSGAASRARRTKPRCATRSRRSSTRW